MAVRPDAGQAHTFWGRQETGENVYEAALDRIRSMYDQCDTVIVSFSGGKDSTVVLNLAIEVATERGQLPVKAYFVDEEAIPYETEDYVRRTCADPRVDVVWWCCPVAHRNACSLDDPVWWCWAPEAEDLWCRPLPPEGLVEVEGVPVGPPEARLTVPQAFAHHFAAQADWGLIGTLMGIRADESLTRRKAVSSGRRENYILPGGAPNILKAYPIYDWTTTDVWTAPKTLGWDYNTAYDLMEMVGIPHHQQRCAPPYGEQPMQGLYTYKLVAPTLWDKMVDRVPGAATAARYSNTQLYSFGALPDRPPEGLTWQEFIAARVADQPPEIRANIAQWVRANMNLHFRKTSDPILSTVPHPRTGVSWQYLYMLADRGDLKHRSWPDYGGAPGTDRRAKAQALYDAARATEDPALRGGRA